VDLNLYQNESIEKVILDGFKIIVVTNKGVLGKKVHLQSFDFSKSENGNTLLTAAAAAAST
jgi:hypothetical protein